MLIQIGGIILLSVSLICLTWYGVTVQKIKVENERKAQAQRNAHNEKIAADNNFALYQQTEAFLNDANEKIKIRNEQIKRRDK